MIPTNTGQYSGHYKFDGFTAPTLYDLMVALKMHRSKVYSLYKKGLIEYVKKEPQQNNA